MANEPFISIVLCTRNRKSALQKYALPSIAALHYHNYEVIVVDDASQEDISGVLSSYEDKIKSLKLVRNNKSRGLCYARNLGVSHCGGEIIAFVDDDSIVGEEWLHEIAKPYLDDKGVMCVGGPVYFRDTAQLTHDADRVLGTNMSFRRSVFKEFRFDENMVYSHFHDEGDLLERMQDRGLKVAFVDTVVVHHYVEPAEYRKSTPVGFSLNLIYSFAKKLSLSGYYYHILIVPLYRLWLKISYGVFKKRMEHRPKIFKQLGLIYPGLREEHRFAETVFIKMPYIVYVLLVEIPIRIKLRLRSE